MKMSWKNIPDDILFMVCENLTYQDVATLSSVCKSWNSICTNLPNVVWKKVFMRYMKTNFGKEFSEISKEIQRKQNFRKNLLSFKDELMRIHDFIKASTLPISKVQTLLNRNCYDPQKCCVSKNGKKIAILDEDRIIRVYFRSSKKEPYRQIMKKTLHCFDYECIIDFSPAGSKLLVAETGSQPCIVTVYDIEDEIAKNENEPSHYFSINACQHATWYNDDVLVGCYLDGHILDFWIVSLDVDSNINMAVGNFTDQEISICNEQECIFGKGVPTAPSDGMGLYCSQGLMKMSFPYKISENIDPWCRIIVENTTGTETENCCDVEDNNLSNRSKAASDSLHSSNKLCYSHCSHTNNRLRLNMNINVKLIIKTGEKSLQFITIDNHALAKHERHILRIQKSVQMNEKIDKLHLTAGDDALYIRTQEIEILPGNKIKTVHDWKEISLQSRLLDPIKVDIPDLQCNRDEQVDPSEILAVSKDFMATTSTKENGILIMERHYGFPIKRFNFNMKRMMTQLIFNPNDQEELITAMHTRRFFSPENLHLPAIGTLYETTRYRIQHWKLKKEC